MLDEVVIATGHAEELISAESGVQWTARTFRWVNVITALAVSVLGTLICISSRAYPLRIDGLPGPGLFPAIVGVGLTVLGALYLVGAIRGTYRVNAGTEPPPTKAALVRALLSLTAIAAAAFAMVPIGFPIVAVACVAVLIRLAGGRWRTAVISGILFAACAFVLVTTALGIQLPAGVLRPVLVNFL